MEVSVTIPPDAEGYTGRQCPKCNRYFKIKFGTGLPGVNTCHCPYCNHVESQQEFWTDQQVEYAKSVAIHNITAQIIGQLKELEMQPTPSQYISIGILVKGSPTPITYYSETELEQKVTCANCTLQYTIYGVFGYCPDCGIHNSKQILEANFAVVLNMMALVLTLLN